MKSRPAHIFFSILILAFSAYAQQEDAYRPKSSSEGILLSTASIVLLIGTGAIMGSSSNGNVQTAGAYLGTIGVLVGPLPGYIYAGESWEGLRGGGLRVGIIGTGEVIDLIYATRQIIVGAPYDNLVGLRDIVGVLLVVDLAYDCIHVGDLIQENSDYHGPVSLRLAPAYSIANHVPGLNIALSW